MTATQLLLYFLKKYCTHDEYMFFRNTIMYNHGNKYFRKRRLFKITFVEDYLSRNQRCLNNYMTRLFILAPNLARRHLRNPRWLLLKNDFNERNKDKTYVNRFNNRTYNYQYKSWKAVGLYVNYYKHLWNKFLKNEVISDKKINSPFKKGEHYKFEIRRGENNSL